MGSYLNPYLICAFSGIALTHITCFIAFFTEMSPRAMSATHNCWVDGQYESRKSPSRGNQP